MRKTKKRIVMVVLLALIAVFAVISTTVSKNVTVDENYTSAAYATVFALLPPIVAIALALFTKEVYSSLFVGIIVGALLYSNGNLELMMNTMFFNEDGGTNLPIPGMLVF